jgi:hypothetical protein
MKVEISRNKFDDSEWWFDFGISCQKTNQKKLPMVFCIALMFFSIYIRW